jgi:alpha-beta hydrolase superfamily lysophospholipase
MPFFSGATGQVYYRHWATPTPRAALIFLHGFGEHSGLYHRYGAALNAHGIDLWALDEIGHGLTEGERGAFGSFEDLVANARTLTGLAREATPDVPLVLGGHSLGSVAALLTALDHQDDYAGVVVSGAPLSPLEWLLDAARDDRGGSIDLDPSGLSSDPFYLGELEHDPLAFTEADIVGLLATAFPPAWERFDVDLPGLALPVLAVHGERDEVAPLTGVQAWNGRLPGLRVVTFPDSGHDILNEVAHREVADAVAAFVLAHAAAASEVPA